jgi:hypothetical protein
MQGARFGGRFCYSVRGHCGGSLFKGVSAMTDYEAEQIAHGLIQGYLGPDHKVIDMQSFYRALLEALLSAHHQGWQDCAALADS